MSVTVQRTDVDGTVRAPATFPDGSDMLLGWITMAIAVAEQPFQLTFTPVADLDEVAA